MKINDVFTGGNMTESFGVYRTGGSLGEPKNDKPVKTFSDRAEESVQFEGVEKDVIGHVDNESDMLRKELSKLGKHSVELRKMLDTLPNGDFPHWWQAKIVKAGEYLSSAKHYLESELPANRKS